MPMRVLRIRPPARYSGTTTWYPHNYTRGLMPAVVTGALEGPQASVNPEAIYRMLCEAAPPKHPDTLSPNGISIIHNSGSSRSPVIHVLSGAFRAPYPINLFSLCNPGGEPASEMPSPPGPPFCPP